MSDKERHELLVLRGAMKQIAEGALSCVRGDQLFAVWIRDDRIKTYAKAMLSPTEGDGYEHIRNALARRAAEESFHIDNEWPI